MPETISSVALFDLFITPFVFLFVWLDAKKGLAADVRRDVVLLHVDDSASSQLFAGGIFYA